MPEIFEAACPRDWLYFYILHESVTDLGLLKEREREMTSLKN